MTTPPNDSTWDFSPVFSLIKSLSTRDVVSGQGRESSSPTKRTTTLRHPEDIKNEISESLGNFNRVWDYLGVQRNVPPPSIPPFETVTAGQTTDKDAYASDGALYYPPSSKSVKWRDEEEGLDLTDVQPESPPDNVGLSKSQRKKRNRRARKAAEVEAQAERIEKKRLLRGERGSGDDSDGSPPAHIPARIASFHTAKSQPVVNDHRTIAPLDLRPSIRAEDPQNRIKTAVVTVNAALQHSSNGVGDLRPGIKADDPQGKAEAVVANVNTSLQSSSAGTGILQPGFQAGDPQSRIKAAVAAVNAALQHSSSGAEKLNGSPEPCTPTPSKSKAKSNGDLRPAQLTPASSKKAKVSSVTQPNNASVMNAIPPALPTTPARPPLATIHDSLKKQWPIADPFAARTLSSSAQVSRTQPQNVVLNNMTTPTPTRKQRYELAPLAFNNPIDRNWSLLLKLINNFPADRAHLLSPLQLSINRPISNGIHVFVDASNIIIGFHDTLKRARNIPQHAHVPRVNLNFHALALLLERRRPVTKRVLAGSTPEIPAFEEARQVGYETNILDKVYKARELTEKQRRYAMRDAGYHSESDSAGNGLLFPMDGVSDGSGHVLPPQRPKWVEQAVDEVLHLKILESIIDTSIPAVNSVVGTSPTQQATSAPSSTAPTMVLATGDAAVAEYSPGFMKMVQRALGKGWNVEVMAWGKSVSMDYRKMEKSAALGDRFKIIELDDYAEELFGEAV